MTKTTARVCGFFGFIFLFLQIWPSNAYAEAKCAQEAGKFTSIDGEVEVRSGTWSGWAPVTTGDVLCEADTIRVGENSRAAIQLANQAVLRLDQNTTLTLVNVTNDNEEWAWLDLAKGTIHSFSRMPWKVKVITPYLKALIGGTEFYARADQTQSKLAVLEGHVDVENDFGRVSVNPGEEAIAQPGTAPYVRTVVHPRDAVQWGLYYPPILSADDMQVDDEKAASAETFRQAAVFAGNGRSNEAFDLLNRIPESERDGRYFLCRAALFLAVGRPDEARADIASSLRLEPETSLAYALRAIINIVQNQQETALIDARHALALQSTPAGRIALSYALQANLQLEAALETMLTVTREHPENALAWARLGELELMLGDRSQAISAAKRAVSLAPSSARALWVLGFSALSDYRNDEAIAAFNKAIESASADPMAHLGLGLAKISSGELIEGRKEIEVAVALDSNNALLRAYLGKAYFSERRTRIDATQYQVAKELDPLDPTAYFYDGIRKQSENRPIEGLHDLQTAKDLNDNREVYRSRLLLDQDRASRGASLARVYKELGFFQTAQREASISLQDDPANASAHRFLSDSYRGVRRREIARVSELLQAQLMQDVNINPIQPSIAETNLNITTLGGSFTPGFNEFTPLYEHNSTKVDGIGFGGNNGTYGGEGAVTALYNRFSFGAAGTHYQSDGWRDNNGLNQTLYDFFAQAAITPQFNVQAEYRHRNSDEGDLPFNFDPNDYTQEKSVKREQDTVRFGLRFTPSVRSNFLFSYIHSQRTQNEFIDGLPIDPTTTITSTLGARDDGDQFEGQYLYLHENFNIIAGFTQSLTERRTDGGVVFDDAASPPPFTLSNNGSGQINNTKGYLYSHLKLPASLTWTLGFSYDDYEEGIIGESKFNPKLGAIWDITTDFRLRGAYFSGIKSALVNNRTIEPTQIAGFNQLFDDPNGTRSTRYGGGFDWHPGRDIFVGGEITWRVLDEPTRTFDDFGQAIGIFEDIKEQLHSLYFYWTPSDRLALNAEFTYDRYWNQNGILTETGTPQTVETFSAPLTASYFHPNGWFGRLGGTFVHQNVKRDPIYSNQGNDSFFLVDAELGYRLPKRWGLVSIGVKNLLNTKFSYQDNSYREFRDEPAIGPYFPDRIIMGRLQFSF
ncbi:FecR domain-containing protein [Methylomonas sp. MgM2]